MECDPISWPSASSVESCFRFIGRSHDGTTEAKSTRLLSTVCASSQIAVGTTFSLSTTMSGHSAPDCGRECVQWKAVRRNDPSCGPVRQYAERQRQPGRATESLSFQWKPLVRRMWRAPDIAIGPVGQNRNCRIDHRRTLLPGAVDVLDLQSDASNTFIKRATLKKSGKECQTVAEHFR